MIKLGQKVICRPFADLTMIDAITQELSIEAVVTYVNANHRWFQVEYGKQGKKTRTCYKFDDIGNAVKLV